MVITGYNWLQLVTTILLCPGPCRGIRRLFDSDPCSRTVGSRVLPLGAARFLGSFQHAPTKNLL